MRFHYFLQVGGEVGLLLETKCLLSPCFLFVENITSQPECDLIGDFHTKHPCALKGMVIYDHPKAPKRT